MNYNGTYKLISSDNFEAVLKKLNVNMVLRKAVQVSKPTITVSVDGNRWTLRQASKLQSNVMEFELGVPRHLTGPDGSTTSSIITKEGDRLLEVRTGFKEPVETAREFTGSQLRVTIKVGDAVCVRVFEKQ